MQKKKILVVDDEPFFVEVMTTRFQAAGFDVVSARNVEEAFLKARKEKPQMIIMDVMMPVTSGYEAMQKIRQDPVTRDIPAIVFSGKAGMRDFFAEIPRVEFFHKPFDFKVLIARVEALIGDHHPSPQVRNAVILGVEDPVVQKIRTMLLSDQFQVFTALQEQDCIELIKKVRPTVVFCQFWEDEHVLDPRKVAAGIASASFSGTRFYVYCKESLGLTAMQHFRSQQIVTYRETSELVRKIEALVRAVNA